MKFGFIHFEKGRTTLTSFTFGCPNYNLPPLRT